MSPWLGGFLVLLMMIGVWYVGAEEGWWTPYDDDEDGALDYDDDPWTHQWIGKIGYPCSQEMEDGGFCGLLREEHDKVYPEQAHSPMWEAILRDDWTGLHAYVPNKNEPGACAAWLPTRGGGQQQCLMSKAMHDD